MFSFFSMIDDYEDRKVERYEEGDVFVSTAAVTDSDDPFETAVAHPAYNDGKIVIVETYASRADAEVGHAKWVAVMTHSELPSQLKDVSTSLMASFAKAIRGEMIYQNKAGHAETEMPGQEGD